MEHVRLRSSPRRCWLPVLRARRECTKAVRCAHQHVDVHSACVAESGRVCVCVSQAPSSGSGLSATDSCAPCRGREAASPCPSRPFSWTARIPSGAWESLSRLHGRVEAPRRSPRVGTTRTTRAPGLAGPLQPRPQREKRKETRNANSCRSSFRPDRMEMEVGQS